MPGHTNPVNLERPTCPIRTDRPPSSVPTGLNPDPTRQRGL
jgi:hypothetical protein